MRKFLISAMLVGSLAPLGACATETPAPAPPSSSRAAVPGADTVGACAAARTATTTAIAELQAIFIETGGTAPADPAKQQAAIDKFGKTADNWSSAFVQLSTRNISPELSEALTAALAVIDSLRSRLLTLTPADGMSAITEINQKIDAACAGT